MWRYLLILVISYSFTPCRWSRGHCIDIFVVLPPLSFCLLSVSVFELYEYKTRRSNIAMDWVSWLQKNKKKIIVSIAGCSWWESRTLALMQQRYRMLDPKISKPWITTSNNVHLLRLKRFRQRDFEMSVHPNSYSEE